MIGIFFITIGVITYCLTPFIVNSVFNITNVGDFTSNNVHLKQMIASILTYSSYALLGLGGFSSLVIGEIYAGYAIFESVKLKNYDKENLYYDYSPLSIASTFLLPFVFLNYLCLQINKEIKYFKREKPEEFMINLISEEKYSRYDSTAKLQYLSYLLKNNVIDEDEYKFLVEEEKLRDEEDKHKDYKKFDDEILSNIFEKEEKEKEKNNKKKSKVIYYELEEELPPITNKNYNRAHIFDDLSKELDKKVDDEIDDQEYIKKLKEETH